MSEPISSGIVQAFNGWDADFQTHVVDIAADSSSVGSLLATAMGYESNGRHRFGSLLDNWLIHAPLTDIIEWRRGKTELHCGSETNVPVDEETIWLTDRFTETYMTTWSQTSVVMEYRYIRGELRPYLPIGLLSLRSISPETVNAELARRAIEERSPALYMETMQRQAVEYLEDGRRDAAAGIFEAARILEPQNGQAHNNYGFCLLPEHPLDALKALRLSAELQGPKVVNSINQAVGHWLLGQRGETMRVLAEAYERGPGEETLAYLWDYFDTEMKPALTTFEVMNYLCRFGLKVARETQDDEAIATWTTRVAALPRETPE